jgi:2-keto-4-pentenoate hydratase
MSQLDHQKIAETLFAAKSGAKPIGKLTVSYPGFSLSDAYQTQKSLLERHLRNDEKLVGRKMGLTSKPKMQQMGVFDPIHGFLTSAMHIADGGEIALKGRIHPKAEPEIAFILGKDL